MTETESAIVAPQPPVAAVLRVLEREMLRALARVAMAPTQAEIDQARAECDALSARYSAAKAVA